MLGHIHAALLLGNIHPEIRGTVYAIAASSGDTVLFQKLLDMYSTVRLSIGWPILKFLHSEEDLD